MTSRTFLTFIAGIALAIAVPVMGQTMRLTFPDVSATASFSSDIANMVNLGVIRGYDDGNFGPNDTVTRTQVAIMFNRYDQEVVQPLRDQIAVINAKLGIGPSCNGHAVGDAYKSPDGCNTCSCTSKGEICTLRACPLSSSASSSSHSSLAAVCGNGICEPGEASYCPSQQCAPGQICPQYCIAGSCQRDCQSSSKSSTLPNWCAPYVCNDGTTIPSCSADGNVIHYFAAPCMTHGGDAVR